MWKCLAILLVALQAKCLVLLSGNKFCFLVNEWEFPPSLNSLWPFWIDSYHIPPPWDYRGKLLTREKRLKSTDLDLELCKTLSPRFFKPWVITHSLSLWFIGHFDYEATSCVMYSYNTVLKRSYLLPLSP